MSAACSLRSLRVLRGVPCAASPAQPAFHALRGLHVMCGCMELCVLQVIEYVKWRSYYGGMATWATRKMRYTLIV